MMTLPNQNHVTEQEFMRMLRQTDRRLELWHGEVYDMTYVTKPHRDITAKFLKLLIKKLPASCTVFPTEPIYPPNTTGVFREPDIAVVCGERRTIWRDDYELTTNPIIIIEVVSPKTEFIDREWKLAEYKSIPSLNYYLIVAQDSPEITLWLRDQQEGWEKRLFAGPDSVIELNRPKLKFSLSEVY